jgi:hypothetical protein
MTPKQSIFNRRKAKTIDSKIEPPREQVLKNRTLV